jgi:hypothetical protein
MELSIWEEVYEIAVDEGIGFEARIHNTTIADWKELFSLLKGSGNYEFFIGNTPQDPIDNIDASLFGKNEYPSLVISINDLKIDCLLLDLHLIEMEIPLTEGFIEHDLDALLSFLEKVSIKLNKKVSIFLEGSETPVMSFPG